MFVIYQHFCKNCALSINILIFPPLPFWLSLLSEKGKTSEREDQCFQIFPQEGTLRPTSCSCSSTSTSTSTSPTQGQRGQQASSSPCARCSWRGRDQMWWPWWSEWRTWRLGEGGWRSENQQRKNENRSLPDLRPSRTDACEKAYWSNCKNSN